MKKKGSSVSSHNLKSFLSPELPNYSENNAIKQKGWSSERIPPHSSSGSRRNISISSLTPFYSGRTLPSKWEDAERWIGSPVIRNGILSKNLQKRPKSKSGPIVSPGVISSPNYSPAVPKNGNGFVGMRNSMVYSPFSTGVLAADAVSILYGGGGVFVGDYGGQSHPLHLETNAERLGSGSRWSDILSESSLVSSLDENQDDSDTKTAVDSCTTQRNKGTQIRPEDLVQSSPKGKSSISSSSSSPALRSIKEPQIDHPTVEMRDVQVDKRATVIRWSKGNKARVSKKELPDLGNLNATITDNADADIDVSKLQRQEARITAWENLQKAKAEAAIRKLEVKLERKRSSSMDKILNRLRKAQMKAHKMRSTLSLNRTGRVPEPYFRFLCIRRRFQMSSLRCCFTCYAS